MRNEKIEGLDTVEASYVKPAVEPNSVNAEISNLLVEIRDILEEEEGIYIVDPGYTNLNKLDEEERKKFSGRGMWYSPRETIYKGEFLDGVLVRGRKISRSKGVNPSEFKPRTVKDGMFDPTTKRLVNGLKANCIATEYGDFDTTTESLVTGTRVTFLGATYEGTFDPQTSNLMNGRIIAKDNKEILTVENGEVTFIKKQ